MLYSLVTGGLGAYTLVSSGLLPAGVATLVIYVDPRQCVVIDPDTDRGDIDPRQTTLIH